MHQSKPALTGIPLLLGLALVLGACTAAEAGIPAGLLESLPADVEFSTEDNSLEFTDTVQTIGTDQWVIGAFTLNIVSSSEIEPGIVEGDLVLVEARLNADGDFEALEIGFARDDSAAAPEGADEDFDSQQDDSFDSELTLIGTVDAMGDSSWVINGETVLVDALTEIKDAIAPGDVVKVEAYLNDNGELTAHEIELADDSQMSDDDFDSDDDLKFTGIVESIEGQTWVIGGETFQVDENSEIDPGIKVGDMVEVYLFIDADGLTLVHEISFEDDGELESDDDLDDDHDDDFDDDFDDDDSSDDEHDEHSGGSSGDEHESKDDD